LTLNPGPVLSSIYLSESESTFMHGPVESTTLVVQLG